MRKKLLAMVLVSVFCMIPLTQGHVHDDACGYNPETNQGCAYEIQPLSDGFFGD